MTAVALADLHRELSLFAEGVAGERLNLAAGRPSDRITIGLPETINDFPTADANRIAYIVAVLHQVGFVENGTYDFSAVTAAELGIPVVATPVRFEWSANCVDAATDQLGEFLAASPDSETLRSVFTVVEAIRIDAATRRHYPGARRYLDQVRSRDLAALDAVTAEDGLAADGLLQLRRHWLDPSALPTGGPNRLLMLAATVRGPAATVYDSVRVALEITDMLTRRQLFEHVGEHAPPHDALDTDLELPLPTQEESGPRSGVSSAEDDQTAAPADDVSNGPGSSFHGDLLADMTYGHGASPAGLDAEQDDGDTPASQASIELDTDQDDGADATPTPTQRVARRSGSRAQQRDSGGEVYLYDEWDYTVGGYLRSWCRLHELPVAVADHEFMAGVRSRYSIAAAQIRRRFAAMRPDSRTRVHRTSDGDELSLDALIEAAVDRRVGHLSDEHLYVRRDRVHRDVAAAFLLDLSGSTGTPIDPPVPSPDKLAGEDDEDDVIQYVRGGGPGDGNAGPKPAPVRRVIDVAKEAVAVMCDSLEALGDSIGVYGFSGSGRDNVQFFVAKDFSDRPSATTWAALGGMSPLRYTRMGPAIRHAAAKIAVQPARMKVLLVISDGYPQDEDYGPDRSDRSYGIHDTARAIAEAQRLGILTFCVTIDPSGHDYLRQMCPDQQYLVIDDIDELTGQLEKVYRLVTGSKPQARG